MAGFVAMVFGVLCVGALLFASYQLDTRAAAHATALGLPYQRRDLVDHLRQIRESVAIVEGMRDGFAVTVQMSTSRMHFAVEIPSAGALCMRAEHPRQARLGGSDDLRLGPPEVDRVVRIVGGDAAELAARFDSSARNALAELVGIHGAELLHGRLTFVDRSRPMLPRRSSELLRLALCVAAAVAEPIDDLQARLEKRYRTEKDPDAAARILEALLRRFPASRLVQPGAAAVNGCEDAVVRMLTARQGHDAASLRETALDTSMLPSVRVESIEHLSVVDPSLAAATCTGLLQDAETAVVVFAAQQLVELVGTRAVGAVSSLMRHRDPLVVAGAIRAMRAVGGRGAEALLRRVVSNFRAAPDLRRLACDALGEIGSRRSLPALRRVSATHGELGHAATLALRRIESREGGPAEGGRLAVAETSDEAGQLSEVAGARILSIVEEVE